jgi:hypothetical protein
MTLSVIAFIFPPATTSWLWRGFPVATNRWLCAGYARLLVGALRERTSFLKPLQLKTA